MLAQVAHHRKRPRLAGRGSAVQLPGGAGSYTVIYNDLPDVVSKQPGAADVVLETIPQQVKANVPGATLVGDVKKLTQDGYPGRELTLELAGKGSLLVRVFLVKQRVYQVMVGGSKDFLASKEAAQF